MPDSDRWVHVVIAVTSPPFTGDLETILESVDLEVFADALDAVAASGTGEAVLGGGRAAELRLTIERQVGGSEGHFVVESSVTPSGDDPYPRLTFLTFDVPPVFADATIRSHEVAGRDPWPGEQISTSAISVDIPVARSWSGWPFWTSAVSASRDGNLRRNFNPHLFHRSALIVLACVVGKPSDNLLRVLSDPCTDDVLGFVNRR